MKILVTKFRSPMMAWGVETMENERPTADFPLKSHVAGLLGAALGIERRDVESLSKLFGDFDYACRYDGEGSPQRLIDFHTALRFKDTQAGAKRGIHRLTFLDRADPNFMHRKRWNKIAGQSISKRHYIVDATYTVLLHLHEKHFPLEEVVDSLNSPTYVLFFGRKCCLPSRPLFDAVIEADTFLEAMAATEPSRGLVWCEEPEGAVERLMVKDVPEFNSARTYLTRAVYKHVM